MKRFDIHVCLVSGQPISNLLPILDELFRPRQVIFITMPAMEGTVEYLRQAILPLGVQVALHVVKESSDFRPFRDELAEILTRFESAQIALNASGGTRWMALIAQEMFYARKKPVFFINPDKGALYFPDAELQPRLLSHRARLEEYFKVYGCQPVAPFVPQSVSKKQRDLCRLLAANTLIWKRALQQLARLAMASNAPGVQISDVLREAPDEHLDDLLSAFKQADMIVPGASGGIGFMHEQAREFIRGGWVRGWVLSVLGKLKSAGVIQDGPRTDVKIQSNQGKVIEIDMVFLANNRLFLIQCGTGFNLDGIRDLKRLTQYAMLVSANGFNEADRQRADDLGVLLVEGSALQQFEASVRAWLVNSGCSGAWSKLGIF